MRYGRPFVLAAAFGADLALISVFPTGRLLGIADAAMVSMALTIVLSYSPAFYDTWWRRMHGGWLTGVEWFVTGIWGIAATILGLRGFAIVWRAAGRQTEWLPNPLGPFTLFLGFLAFVALLLAQEVKDRVIPRSVWTRIGATVGVVLFSSMLLAWVFDILDVLY